MLAALVLTAVALSAHLRDRDSTSRYRPPAPGLMVGAPTTAPPHPTATTHSPETTLPDPPRSFTLVATGDLLSHGSVLEQARADHGGRGYDYSRMFRFVTPIITAADVAICHLETPIVPPGVAPGVSLPIFGAPPEIATEIARAGYDRCSTASNHSLDQRVAGIDATVNALEAAGLGQAGMARTAAEALPARFEVNGIDVAHISASYGFNGFSPPASEPWRVNGIDVPLIVNQAHAARRAGAEVIVVSLHWGIEGRVEPTVEQRSVAEALSAADVDLIIGHHAHVVQPIEQINGTWVVFGLGNQLSGMGDRTSCCGVRALDGLTVRVQIDVAADGTVTVHRPEAIPTFLGRRPYRIVPVLDALADPDIAGHISRRDLEASWARSEAVIGDFVTR